MGRLIVGASCSTSIRSYGGLPEPIDCLVIVPFAIGDRSDRLISATRSNERSIAQAQDSQPLGLVSVGADFETYGVLRVRQTSFPPGFAGANRRPVDLRGTAERGELTGSCLGDFETGHAEPSASTACFYYIVLY